MYFHKSCSMFWIIILLVLLLIVGWLLLSPIEMHIDTRVPHASFSWLSIGGATVVYEKQDWFLKVKIFLFRKEWSLSKLLAQPAAKDKKPEKVKKARRTSNLKVMNRAIKMLRTFRVIEWKLALDGNDHLSYAMLYPLNFLPYLGGHIYINYEDETYLQLKIRNQPWRMVYAWIK